MLLITLYSFSQDSTTETSFWKLNHYSGEVTLYGTYWDQKTIRNNNIIDEKNSLLLAGILLNTNSYFYHPNFLSLDFNIGYSPDTGQRFSLVTPDRNETHSLKKLYIKTSFLQRNDFNFNFFLNYNENYSNRENLTNIKTKNYTYGGALNYSNKIAPVFITYSSGKGKQEETQTNRIFKTERNNIDARATKSFGQYDRNELRFSHNAYTYDDSFTSSSINPNDKLVESNITSWNLNNNIYFDSKKNYNLRSRIINDDQYGNINFKRFQVLENLTFKLPKNFTFYGGYNFYDYKSDAQNSKQHNISGSLTHQLYKSLRTTGSLEYNIINNTQFKDEVRRIGFDILYDKKIPMNGHLSLIYKINSNKQDRKGDSSSLIIQNEAQRLIDGQIVLLNNQNIVLPTIIVRDVTNTIIYQLNLDYILIDRNEFIEIQRVPGGLIANSTTVLIDYEAIQPSSYKFNAINNYLGIRVSLFKNLLEFYASTSKQDYKEVENPENLTLNYFNKNIYGTRFNYKFMSGGIEYDNYDSSIIPYRLMRYYLTLQGTINQKLSYSLNGEFLDYLMIEFEGQKQVFYNVSGNIAYNFSAKTRLNLEGGYRKQDGDTDGIYLNLLTSRLEFTTVYRQVFVTAALEIYRRDLVAEQLDFNKVSLKISRRF